MGVADELFAADYSDLILGHHNPYEDHYKPSRVKPLAAAATSGVRVPSDGADGALWQQQLERFTALTQTGHLAMPGESGAMVCVTGGATP